MKHFKFIQIGGRNYSLLEGVVSKLSTMQEQFDFSFTGDYIPLKQKGVPVEHEKCSDMLRRYAITKKIDGVPIGIVFEKIDDDETLWYLAEDAYLISLPLISNAAFSVEKTLLFALSSVLMDAVLSKDLLEIHPRGDKYFCPNDYCVCVKDLVDGMRVSAFCAKCQNAIGYALDQGYLLPAEYGAIHRVLDYVIGRKTAFVIMPFGGEFNETYEIIKSICHVRGFTCERADEMALSGIIINQIFAAIHRASVLIADVTIHNPNVFYELGYAHCCGIKTFLLRRDRADLPFDVQHRRALIYASSDELRRLLDAGLLAGAQKP